MTNKPAQDARPVPQITKALLDYLQEVFPDRSPDRGDSLDDIRYKAGQVSVVRYLAYHFRAQNKNVLASPEKPSRVSRIKT